MRRFIPGLFVILAALGPLAAQDSRPTSITLDEILLESGKFDVQLPRQLQWRPDGKAFAHASGTGASAALVMIESGGKPEPVVTVAELSAALAAAGANSELKGLPALRFTPDGKALTFAMPRTKPRPAMQSWRFDLATRKLTALHTVPSEAEASTVSRDGAVAYVSDYNISVLTPDGVTHPVTKDGHDDIHHGVSVHREEFGIKDGLWWDPTGRRLAFYREDLRPIAPYPYVDTTTIPATAQHGRYPMAGAKSSVVTVGVWDVRSGETTWLDTDTTADWWLTNVTFGPSGNDIYVARVNRGQNSMDLVRFDCATGKLDRLLFTEKDDQWIEPEHGPLFVPGHDDQFLWLTYRDGWCHYWLYDTAGTVIRQVGKGTHDVQVPLGFTPDGSAVHYLAAANDDPRTLHLWKATLADGEARQVTAGRGRRQVIMTPDLSRALLIRHDIETPPVVEVLDVATGQLQAIAKAANPFATRLMGTQRFFTVESPRGGTLYGHLILPPNFDETKKYPVLCYVYGGPHTQLVTDSWLGGASLWLHWLATQGIVVYRVDGHGTPNRGIEFEQVIHRHLGTVEIEDQLAALQWIKAQPFVDPARVAVHGWSFGGFMTASLMCRAPDAFKCGISGAPVTDWALYETGYGERYMDTPAENPEGYAEANIATYVKQLKGRLLIIQGTADDTVVWQNTLRLIDRFIQEGVDVDYFVYPGQKHGVVGKAKVHLYRKMTRWLMEHL